MTVNIKLNIIDRIIKLFAPLYAEKRLRARAMIKNKYIDDKPAFPRRRIIAGGVAPSTREFQGQGQNSNESTTSSLCVQQQPEEACTVPYEDDQQKDQCPAAIPPSAPQRGRYLPPRHYDLKRNSSINETV